MRSKLRQLGCYQESQQAYTLYTLPLLSWIDSRPCTLQPRRALLLPLRTPSPEAGASLEFFTGIRVGLYTCVHKDSKYNIETLLLCEKSVFPYPSIWSNDRKMAASFNGDNRAFLIVLNAVKERLFEGVVTSNENIGEQIRMLGVSVDSADVDAEVGTIEELLRKSSEGNWEISKLENVLNRAGTFTQQQIKLCIAWWTNEKEKIHASVVKKTTFNKTLHQLSWRVDIRTASKSSPEINEPLALFEITTSGSQAKFEINKPQVVSILEQLEEAQKRMEFQG